MPKTLLAVDDSVTMRKALEITFSGDDFRVLTADGPAAALAKAGEADVILVDTVLGGDDGYALASQLRRARPGVAIVLLTSRYNPHDQGKAREAGADDFADKPFDTQQLLDKVRKVMVA
ncbi:MAG: response regulator, partial [Myxococcales bacterium]|nr:response regulator [Myxococcales bacterium]